MVNPEFAAVLFLSLIHFAFASEWPELSPVPAPESGDTASLALAPSPVGSPDFSPLPASPPSPVAPSPSDLSPNGSPTSSPSPAPGESDINRINVPGEEDKEFGGGMRGGKKAGIVTAVVTVACSVWFARRVDSEISVWLFGEEGGTVNRRWAILSSFIYHELFASYDYLSRSLAACFHLSPEQSEVLVPFCLVVTAAFNLFAMFMVIRASLWLVRVFVF
ncbi:hypothetical protein SLE2022_285110 [Rubroshorea leprosula]